MAALLQITKQLSSSSLSAFEQLHHGQFLPHNPSSFSTSKYFMEMIQDVFQCLHQRLRFPLSWMDGTSLSLFPQKKDGTWLSCRSCWSSFLTHLKMIELKFMPRFFFLICKHSQITPCLLNIYKRWFENVYDTRIVRDSNIHLLTERVEL